MFKWPKSGLTELNRKPRDCTAPAVRYVLDVQSPTCGQPVITNNIVNCLKCHSSVQRAGGYPRP